MNYVWSFIDLLMLVAKALFTNVVPQVLKIVISHSISGATPN